MPTNCFGGRVLVLGLDMGDGSLIRHWSQSGRPALRGPRIGRCVAGAGQHGAGAAHVNMADICHRDDARASWSLLSLPAKTGLPAREAHRAHRARESNASTRGDRARAAGHRLRRAGDVSEAAFRGEAVFDWGTWPASKPCAAGAAGTDEVAVRSVSSRTRGEAPSVSSPGPDGGSLVRAVAYKAATAGWLLGHADWISPSSGCVRRIRRVITCGRPAPRRSTRRMRRCSSSPAGLPRDR